MSFTKQALTALKRIFIVLGIAVAFTLGLLGAVYLSLRSSETKVPDIIGKDRTSAEDTISSAGLNFRVRATRPTSEAKPDTVLIQLPHAGEIVKVGQTVAVDISRSAKEGESTNGNTNADSEKSENTNSTTANSNDDKEKKKPANKNTNDNLNANGNLNRATNRNRNANASPVTNLNANINPTGSPVHSNLNSNSAPGNANRGAGNVNSNRRPPAASPTP